MGLCIGDEFTLATVYGSEEMLNRLPPNNNHIKAKSDNNFKFPRLRKLHFVNQKEFKFF